jgi:uncharacterized FAD-dependent dehydrogenase
LDTGIFVVANIKLDVNASVEEAFSVARMVLVRLGLDLSEAEPYVYKRSVDARKRDKIVFVYSIAFKNVFGHVDAKRLSEHHVSLIQKANLSIDKFGTEILSAPPIIVGAGPCGLFTALILAENGYKPVLIERGGSVNERKRAVNAFYTAQTLDSDNNIQFGAGGAGTFSDGKLVTRVNDPYTSYVLERLVENGAPKEILYVAKPHVGTDVLSTVVENLISKIKEFGGTVLFNTKFIDTYTIGKTSIARTTSGDMPYGALVLALGHSARDTYKTLIDTQFSIEPKPFSVGMRIEHLAADIDKSLYGNFAGNSVLGHAEYNLSYDTKNRGVYTFCMCPGGEVVAASSENGGVVVNGMSYNARNGKNSNSAVVCSIYKGDYGNTPSAAIEFQRKIEKAAFIAAGSDYSAPMITVGDFLTDMLKNEPTSVKPSYMRTGRVRLVSPNEYLPSFVTSQIKNALYSFDKSISGFANKNAILTGPETRTSAPIRILRDGVNRLALQRDNVYPAGEGAGYAGGITSAAIDGIRTALAIIERYKKF